MSGDDFDDFVLPEPPQMVPGEGDTFDQAGIDALFGFADAAPQQPKSGLKAVIESNVISYERLPMLEVVCERTVRTFATSMRNLTSRQIAVLLGCVLTLATLAVGVYGLVRGPQSAESTPAPPPPGAFGAIPKDATPVVTLKDRALPHTNDPIAYSRAVASSLFDWDTSLGFLPTDYTAAVLADADPSGEDSAR